MVTTRAIGGQMPARVGELGTEPGETGHRISAAFPADRPVFIWPTFGSIIKESDEIVS